MIQKNKVEIIKKNKIEKVRLSSFLKKKSHNLNDDIEMILFENCTFPQNFDMKFEYNQIPVVLKNCIFTGNHFSFTGKGISLENVYVQNSSHFKINLDAKEEVNIQSSFLNDPVSFSVHTKDFYISDIENYNHLTYRIHCDKAEIRNYKGMLTDCFISCQNTILKNFRLYSVYTNIQTQTLQVDNICFSSSHKIVLGNMIFNTGIRVDDQLLKSPKTDLRAKLLSDLKAYQNKINRFNQKEMFKNKEELIERIESKRQKLEEEKKRIEKEMKQLRKTKNEALKNMEKCYEKRLIKDIEKDARKK